ncbi:transposase, partial [Methylobacterium sp. 13MFTsu3.1M2]|uniref:transposase n=1 Tax=Methylobacterium sp. 13MFTsu3.1M2 TaxID=1502776 RepID=UPI001FCDDB64
SPDIRRAISTTCCLGPTPRSPSGPWPENDAYTGSGPCNASTTPVACPDWIYNNRNQIERLWARLKEWRAVATRYEKTAASFIGVLSLAAALDWLKR